MPLIVFCSGFYVFGELFVTCVMALVQCYSVAAIV